MLPILIPQCTRRSLHVCPSFSIKGWRRKHARTFSSDSAPPAKFKFKVLFCGRDEFSCLVLQQLYRAQTVWEDIHLVTQPDTLVGRRGSKLSVSPLKLIGQDLGLSVTEIPHEKRDFRTWKPPSPFLESSDFTTVGRNHVLVTASFGRIIPAAVLQLFPTGQRLNVHPSLLPKYRGAAPIQHTIINKDAETGVSIVEMLKFSQGLDCGDIWGQDRMTVPDNTNFFTLRDTLAEAGGKLLVRVLQEKIEGASKSTIQDKTKIYPLAPALTADNAHVDFKSLTVNDILALYRGISHQRPITSKARNGKLLQLHSLSRPSSPVSAEIPGTSVLNPQKETLLIHCRDGTALEVGELKWEGKGLVPAKEWWNGAKSLGLVQDGRVMLIV